MVVSSFDNFAKYGVIANKGLFLQIGLLGPVAITCAALASKIYQNPGVVKEKLQCVKQAIANLSFKKIIAVIAALSLAGACPFIFLPAAFAIPAALIAIGSVALIMKNGQKWKHQIVAAFTPQTGEPASDARKRILKNIIFGLAAASLAIALSVLGAHWMGALLSGSIWGFASIIPQTKLALFLEYGALGLIHLALAFKAKNKGQMLFHLGCGILSFVFPAFYCFFSPASDIRLHHSFLGLLLQLMPFPGLQFFGSMVMLDSSLYLFSSARGFIDNGIFRSADFMNIVVDHLPSFVLVLTATSVIYTLAQEFLFSRRADQTKTVDLRCGRSETEMTSSNESSTNLNLEPSSAFN